MSINLDTIVLPRLADGKHNVHFANVEVINNEKGGYLKVDIVLEDRKLQWNIFPKQFNYVFGNLQRIFNLEEQEVTQRELLDLAQNNNFDMYTSTSAEYGRNWAFTEPAPEVEPEEVEF